MNGPTDVKSKLCMITVEDFHFTMWKEFIEKHHRGELINPDTGDMYKDRALFTLSSKFQLTHEFFKHFGHFTNADFKVYVQHLLGRTPGHMSAYPKITVHKTALVHAFHHTGHEWVERRKRKRVVMEKLVELQPDLKFIRADGSVDGDEWRNWKLDHRVSSGTYNILLYLPGSQYFSKRLTNEGKLKRASEFQKKFSNVLLFFRNFLRLKLNLRPRMGHIRLRGQDSVSLSLLREWNYNEDLVAGFGLMDLRIAPATADRDSDYHDPAFFAFIHKIRRMSKPAFTDPCMWFRIHSTEERVKQSTAFVRQFLSEYETIQSVYHASKNERLDDAKTRAPPTLVHLLFLFKRGDDRASCLRQNVRKKFTVPSDVPYYTDVERNMEAKYRVYASKLRMEFYFELLNLFCRAGENIIDIHSGAKFMLAAKVCLARSSISVLQ